MTENGRPWTSAGWWGLSAIAAGFAVGFLGAHGEGWLVYGSAALLAIGIALLVKPGWLPVIAALLGGILGFVGLWGLLLWAIAHTGGFG